MERDMKSDHVVIVISSLGGGGAERVVAELSRYLTGRGRVTVFTLNGDDADIYPLDSLVHRERIDIRRQSSSIVQSVKNTLRQLWDIRRKILSLRPTVVLSFIDQTNIRTTLSMIGTGIPVLVAERNHPEFHELPEGWRKLRKVSYRFAAATIVQTKDAARWFNANVKTKRLIEIPNAVREIGPTIALRKPEKLVLGVGRLAHEKGFDILVEAFAKSEEMQRDGWRLAILGEGPERDNLKKLASDLGVLRSLSMPGHVSNVIEWMHRAGIFVLSSRTEGFPNTLLEAMQMGVPCISTNCPAGPSTLIEDGLNGLLIPIDDVHAMASCMHRLSGDEAFRIEIGANAERVNLKYSPTHVYGMWADAIDSIVRPNHAISPTPETVRTLPDLPG
jgi:glycosyltransferase involved in cell wall biosynthesis